MKRCFQIKTLKRNQTEANLRKSQTLKNKKDKKKIKDINVGNLKQENDKIKKNISKNVIKVKEEKKNKENKEKIDNSKNSISRIICPPYEKATFDLLISHNLLSPSLTQFLDLPSIFSLCLTRRNLAKIMVESFRGFFFYLRKI